MCSEGFAIDALTNAHILVVGARKALNLLTDTKIRDSDAAVKRQNSRCILIKTGYYTVEADLAQGAFGRILEVRSSYFSIVGIAYRTHSDKKALFMKQMTPSSFFQRRIILHFRRVEARRLFRGSSF
jgi:hypothetical protein